MTVKEGTICNLIQTFPVLLILAQNANKCLKTPLLYKPPSPTHSPEYYEALDALFQNLYGNSHNGNHGASFNGNHGYQVYETTPRYHYQTPTAACQYSYGYGKKWFDSIGGFGKPCYQYVYGNSYGTSFHGYPSSGLKKDNIYSLGNHSTNSYAPSQVYSTNNRYKVVVKKTKIGSKRSSGKTRGFFTQRDSQRDRPLLGILDGAKRVREGITGFLKPRPKQPEAVYQGNTQNTPTAQNNYASNGGLVVFPDSPKYQTPNPYGNNNFGQNQDDQGQGQSYTNQDNMGPMNFNPGYQTNQNNANGHQESQGADGNQGQTGQANEVSGGGFEDRNSGTEAGQDIVPANDPVNFEATSAPVVPFTERPTTTTTTEPITTTLPPLTSVPKSESRNSFQFGSSGVFKGTCETVDGGVGSCISVFECQPYMGYLQQSRSNPEAVRILRKAHCGFDGSNPKVCCPLADIPSTPQPPTTVRSTTTTTTPVPTQSSNIITSDDLVPSLPEPPYCGVSNATLGRVVGGVDAKLGDFPWTVVLGYNKTRTGSTLWACGGSLISSKHILTAAHCIHNLEKELYVVRLGELDLTKDDDGATPVDILIKKKIKHEKYNPRAYTNDIAILVLEKEVQFTDLIKPICIPKEIELRAKSFEDFNPLIAGWGKIDFRGPSAAHLQVVQLPVVNNEACAQAYKKYTTQVIDERSICAGYENGGKDSCSGDSGGALMQPIWSKQTYKTYFYQIGVVSYGKGCAEAGYPGVYSRVTHFVPWIMKTVVGDGSQ